MTDWKEYRKHQSARFQERFTSVFSTLGESDVLPEPLDFARLTDDGFRRNAIIHACIRRISRSVAEPKLKAVTVLPSGELQTNFSISGDPLAILLENPNFEQDQYELFEQLVIHLMAVGNGFLYKIRSPSGNILGLETIRPDLMGLIPGKNRAEGKVKAYTVRVDQSGKRVEIPKEDIIHFKLPDALDEYWGLSPIYTLARYGDIDAQAMDFLRAYFKNKGIPSGLLTFSGAVQKPERERVKELWKEQFQGLTGWHNIAVIDANTTYQPLAPNVERMDMSVVTSQSETRICMVYGVPPVLIGTQFGLGQASFSNLEASEKIFWQDNLSPMFARISRKLTRELAQAEFGLDRQAIFDLSGVAALTENKTEIRKVALQGFDRGLLTRNESKALLGLTKQDKEGDVYKLIPGTVFVSTTGVSTVVEPELSPTAIPGDIQPEVSPDVLPEGGK